MGGNQTPMASTLSELLLILTFCTFHRAAPALERKPLAEWWSSTHLVCLVAGAAYPIKHGGHEAAQLLCYRYGFVEFC